MSTPLYPDKNLDAWQREQLQRYLTALQTGGLEKHDVRSAIELLHSKGYVVGETLDDLETALGFSLSREGAPAPTPVKPRAPVPAAATASQVRPLSQPTKETQHMIYEGLDTSTAFASAADKARAFANPLYATDSAFREAVAAKLMVGGNPLYAEAVGNQITNPASVQMRPDQDGVFTPDVVPLGSLQLNTGGVGPDLEAEAHALRGAAEARRIARETREGVRVQELLQSNHNNPAQETNGVTRVQFGSRPERSLADGQ
jgi:hypothetical protein